MIVGVLHDFAVFDSIRSEVNGPTVVALAGLAATKGWGERPLAVKRSGSFTGLTTSGQVFR
jgi:hypothetical protein